MRVIEILGNVRMGGLMEKKRGASDHDRLDDHLPICGLAKAETMLADACQVRHQRHRCGDMEGG
jgi:hypothetical protein